LGGIRLKSALTMNGTFINSGSSQEPLKEEVIKPHER
jgi:hypothetical protein